MVATVDAQTTAQAYLELLYDRGIECFFANAGSDFAPLIDAFARFAAQGKPAPQPITVPHENAAVAMASGYYLVTGRPQAVMVHVNVGTANALSGIINAARDHIPILVTAGRTPINEAGFPGARDSFIQWAQESFDQAAMVREYVKWDYELRNPQQLEAVVDRALEIAMAEPRGPVYLSLPREVLAEPLTAFSPSSPPRRHLGGPIYPDPQTIEAAAEMLAEAENPLIITTAVGRDPSAVAALVSLAERMAIPVVAFNARYMCFPTDHLLHVGFSPDPFLAQADAILVIDSDVPWYPGVSGPSAGCKVIQLGVDPTFGAYPMRSFPCDVAIRANPAVALRMLEEALAPYCKRIARSIEARYERCCAIHQQQRADWRAALDRTRDDSPLDPLWVSHCIDEIKDDDTIIVNEYDLVSTQVELTRPGSYFGVSPGSGLGWGLGASLGAKLAAPARLVIATLGDGSYMFGNPTPCHFVARAQGLATLTVVFNNGAWNSVRMANLAILLDLDVLLSTVLALLPGVGRAAPEAAGIFVGPVQRLVRQRVPWFALDWLTALIAIAAAGLIWRAAWPLDLGWERALVGALAMALAFSLTNRLLRVQHTAWRYASSQEVIDLALSTALSTGLIVGADRLLMTQPHLPLGMLLLTGLLALVGFIAARYRHRLLSGLACRLRPTLGLARERVLVVGGGEAGQLMVWLLQNGAGARALQVVGIVDDDLWKRGERIHRVRVLGDRTAIPALVQAYDEGLIVFAIHHIAPSEREAILDLCRSTPARVVLVPDVVGLLTQLARSAAHPESRFEKGSVGERSDGNGRGMPPGQLPDVGRIAGSHCDGRPILAPPIHLGEASGLAVDAATVAHWLDDVERLLAQGRTADAEQRLAEIRASLLVTE
jgi:acetolactate synthase-1/2/3 large subunit